MGFILLVFVILLQKQENTHIGQCIQIPEFTSPAAVRFTADIALTHLKMCHGVMYLKEDSEDAVANYLRHVSLERSLSIPNLAADYTGIVALNHSRMKTKFGENCLFHLIELQSVEDVVVNNAFLHETSKPYPSPTIQRNLDYFLFLVSPRVLNFLQSSLNNQLVTKIRNKLLIVSESKSSNAQVSVYHICNFCKPTDKIQRLQGENLRKEALFPNYIRNLHGHTLRVSLPTAVVGRVGLELQRGEYKIVRGMQGVLVIILSQDMNFTYKAFPSSGGGGSGLQLPNGSWDGVVGDVYHGRADFGTGTAISIFRNPFVGIHAIYEYVSLGIVHGPTQKVFTWKTIFWPFTTSVWLYLIFFITLAFAALILLQIDFQKNFTLQGRRRLCEVSSSDLKISDVYYFLYATLVYQNVKLPLSSTVRIFAAYWLLFVIVISTAYSSKLFGFLVFPIHEPVPQTFEELADSDYDVGLGYLGGAAYNSFKTSETPALKKIFKRMDIIKDSFTCLERALKSRFCCISYGLQFEYSVQRNFSDDYGRTRLSLAPARVFPISVGLSFPKDSIIADTINWKTRASFEGGLVKRWSDEDFIETRRKKISWRKGIGIKREVLSDGREPIALTVPHFTGAFSVLITGSVIGIAVLVKEMLQVKIEWKKLANILCIGLHEFCRILCSHLHGI